MQLTEKQIRDNELYFHNVLTTLNEGGVFMWKDLGETLVKRDGRFVCERKSYDKAKEITSKVFFDRFFMLK